MKRKEEFKVELFLSLGKTNSYGVKIGCTEKRSFKLLKKKNDENGPFLILEAMIEDCVFILINLYNTNTKNKLVSTWQKMNLMPQTFGDLENKIIIFGGNFNLFLEPVLGTEGGSPVLKKLLFENSLKLKKNTTYVKFGELEIQKKIASHFDKNVAQAFYKKDWIILLFQMPCRTQLKTPKFYLRYLLITLLFS